MNRHSAAPGGRGTMPELMAVRTQKEVARMMNLSPARIYQIEKCALAKLRKRLAPLFDDKAGAK